MTQNHEKLPQGSFERIPRDTKQAERISKPSVSFWQDAWRRLRKNKGAIFSIILFGLIVIMSLLGPIISLMNQMLRQSRMPTFHQKFR